MKPVAGQQQLIERLVILASGVSLASFVMINLPAWRHAHPSPIFLDYLVFWSSGPALRTGGPALVFDVRAFSMFQETLASEAFGIWLRNRFWLYPPSFLLIASTFSQLPFFLSAIVFQIGGFILLRWVIGVPVIAFLALLVSPGAVSTISAGQLSAWLTACIIGGLAVLESHPVLAGMLWGAVSLKPHLFPLLPLALVARRSWPSLLSCIGTAALFPVLSIIAYGWMPWALWLDSSTGATQIVTTGLQSYLEMGSVMAAVRSFGGSVALSWTLQTCSAAIASLVVWCTFRRSGSLSVQSLILSCAILLFAPYWMAYDVLLPSVAVVLLVRHRWITGYQPGEVLSWMLLWMLPVITLLTQGFMGISITPLIVASALVLAHRTMQCTVCSQ